MTAETPEKIALALLTKPERCQRLLVDSKTAASICGCGLTLWKKLVTTGRTPQPIRLSSKKLFCVRQLELWALNGCPSRDSEKWKEILNERNKAN